MASCRDTCSSHSERGDHMLERGMLSRFHGLIEVRGALGDEDGACPTWSMRTI